MKIRLTTVGFFFMWMIFLTAAESEAIKVSDKNYFKMYFNKENIKELESKSDANKLKESEVKSTEKPESSVKDKIISVPEPTLKMAEPTIVTKTGITTMAPVYTTKNRLPLVRYGVSIDKLKSYLAKKNIYLTKKGNVLMLNGESAGSSKIEKLYGRDDMLLLVNNTERKSELTEIDIFAIERLGFKKVIYKGKNRVTSKKGLKIKLFLKEFQYEIY